MYTNILKINKMGIIDKNEVKEKAVNFAKDTVKDEVQGAIEDKVTEVVLDKSLDYAMENAGAQFLPWWAMFLWWPIKKIALLISWPIRILFKKKK